MHANKMQYTEFLLNVNSFRLLPSQSEHQNIEEMYCLKLQIKLAVSPQQLKPAVISHLYHKIMFQVAHATSKVNE